MQIGVAGEGDLADLLELMRAYCEFYETAPTDGALQGLSRSLMADSEREGVQFIARGEQGEAEGFATIFWSWTTTDAARIAIMNDLYVRPQARGKGLAERLIEACVERARRQGAVRLEWQTAPENLRAQAVYERVGAVKEHWLDYVIAVGPG